MGVGSVLTGPWLRLGGSLAAVLALALYVHWLWDRRGGAGIDRDGALSVFAAEHPEAAACDALVTENGRAALVRLADGERLGLVAAFGARWRTRVIGACDVARLETSGTAVRLALREIAQPELVLRFPAEADAAAWVAPLRRIAR